MRISEYSLIMTILWSSFFILFIFFFRRSNLFIRYFGLNLLLLLFFGCFVRLFLPFEFSFTQVIRSETLLNPLVQFFGAPRPFFWGASVLQVFCAVWLTISLSLLTHHLFVLRQFYKRYARFPMVSDKRIRRIAKEVIEPKDYNHVKIIYCPEGFSPRVFGYFHVKILLPNYPFTDTELYNIIRHEYVHYKNRDAWIQLAVDILCIIFFWNPMVYLLRRDLDRTLELKCDYEMVQKYTTKKAYLQTLDSVIEQIKWQRKLRPPATSRFEVNAEHQRIQLLGQHKNHDRRKKSIFFVIGAALIVITLFVSYLFVFQPYYVPDAEAFDEEGVRDWKIEEDGAYIVSNGDGSYTFHDGDNHAVIDKEAMLHMKESGIPVFE